MSPVYQGGTDRKTYRIAMTADNALPPQRLRRLGPRLGARPAPRNGTSAVFRPKHRYDLACGNAFASIHLGLAGADGVVQTRAIFIVQIVPVLHHGERDFATIR